jgi:hypothetical protein
LSDGQLDVHWFYFYFDFLYPGDFFSNNFYQVATLSTKGLKDARFIFDGTIFDFGKLNIYAGGYGKS